MARKKTLKYIFSFLLIVSWLGSPAQKPYKRGLSVGADLSKIVVPFIDTTRYGWEFSADYEILKNMFGAVEIGSETFDFSKPLYDYHASGVYTRLGVDYNFGKHLDVLPNDKMFIGLRYAFTTFAHKAENITVKNPAWGDYAGGNIGNNWLVANWFEIGLGMRTHLFNNFHLGWSAQVKIKLGATTDNTMAPYGIPGYGRAANSTNMGINYSLIYKIPLEIRFKKKEKPVEGE
ncbi:MAG: DUF6048 family protein [Prolixibacteraceae bacterium]|nr:DUF6048 family protein [Prolixibacteraceae bacterium]